MKNIRKKLTALGLGIVFTGFATVTFAQQQQVAGESMPTPKFGVKGGINLSNLYTDNVQDKNMKLGGTGGVYAKIPLVKGLSLQPEVLYSMKGAQVNYNNLLGSGKYRYNLDYIDVPLTAVVNVFKNFNIQAGGYTSFLVSAKIKDVDENGNIHGVTEMNKDNFESFDYGLVGGIGFDVENVNLGIRYNYGLKNIGKEGSLAGNLLQNSKHSVIALTIAFAF